MGSRSHRLNVAVSKKSRERKGGGCEDPRFVSSYIERRQADEASEKQEKARSQRISGN